ncbi:hypothetical protein EZV62_006902 [Acer yangbiense]|uniref:F-box domain-containing protein n=1 Tax=Acer yangbiense TaxID=1000413 RepID=A0A5C7I8Y0_9ROSI|nr:hypothetical protein EZV62_006902 [Acer yangbiense]
MTKSNWADLPTEILRMIMIKLFWSERLPSCLVKKTWHKCFLEIQNEQQFLPWVLSYGRGGICRLGNPSVQAASCIVKEANIDLLDGAVACASRHGWVLFEKKLDDPDNTLTNFYYQYFLYSPFTDEVIKFPKLKMGHSRKATLFQSPSSPGRDFVYCVLTERELGLRPKDDKCRIKMGAFNIKQQDWKVFSGFLPDKNNLWYHCLSITFKGDILVQINNSNRRMQFWRFDLSEEKWVDVDDEIIKKQVIFTTACTSYPEGYTSFTVPAVRDARQYAGMVFSLDANYFRYPYNFTCYPFDHIPDSHRDSESHQWVNEDYKWVKEDCKLFKMFWIQHPFQRILKMN